MRHILTSLLFSGLLCFPVANAWASSDTPLADIDFDRSSESIKRGAYAAKNMCMICHNLKYIKYLNLLEIDFTQSEVDTFRGEAAFDSPVQSSTSPEVAQKLFGMVPPDLSLMAKARRGGARYIYTLLTSYQVNNEGVVENHLFPGIKMPDPLSFAYRTDEARQKELKQTIQDVAVFLEWAADPRAGERRHLGLYVIGYLIVLTFLFYLLKRKIWSRLD